MSELELTQLGGFWAFVAVFARIAPLVAIAPIFAPRQIPWAVRFALALCLALMIAPLQIVHASAVPTTLPTAGLLLGGELLIGATIGLGLAIFFCSFQLAGGVLGRSAGISWSEFAGETGDNAIGKFLYCFGICIFFLIGGHRLVIAGLLDSFQTMPVASGSLPGDIVATTTYLLTDSFRLSLSLAAPALIAVLATTLLIGVVGRVAPQINTWTAGFGLHFLVLLGALLLSLGGIAYLVGDRLPTFVQRLLAFLA